MEDGRFIVFEGLDGSGKDTLLNNLIDYLNKENREDVKVASWYDYPNYRVLKESLKDIANTEDISSLIISLATADMIHMSKDINKYLNDDFIVLCSRWYFSTFAYNGKSDVLENLITNKHILTPRLLVYVDTPVEECIKRINSRPLTIEKFENEDTLRKIDKMYKEKLNEIKDNKDIDVLVINGLEDPKTCLEKLISYVVSNNYI